SGITCDFRGFSAWRKSFRPSLTREIIDLYRRGKELRRASSARWAQAGLPKSDRPPCLCKVRVRIPSECEAVHTSLRGFGPYDLPQALIVEGSMRGEIINEYQKLNSADQKAFGRWLWANAVVGSDIAGRIDCTHLQLPG